MLTRKLSVSLGYGGMFEAIVVPRYSTILPCVQNQAESHAIPPIIVPQPSVQT
jgi:hypothetical protein